VETCLSHDDISEAAHHVLDRFMKSPLLRVYPDKHAGWIGVKVDREGGCGRAEFVFAHTTQTMVSWGADGAFAVYMYRSIGFFVND
jgi:hypothetical protein